MVDAVQKCAHLIEALNIAQPDAKVFRNHCLEISSCANRLLPQILNVQKQLPNLGDDPGASELFNKLDAVMEEALTLLRKCATMSKLDKMMDQGLSFVNEQKAQLPTGLVSHIPTMPKSLMPEGLMQGLSKSIFGDHGPPSGDTKSHLVAVLEQLQKSTREIYVRMRVRLVSKEGEVVESARNGLPVNVIPHSSMMDGIMSEVASEGVYPKPKELENKTIIMSTLMIRASPNS